MSGCVAVIAAAGSGARFGGNKQFAPLCGRAVLWHSVAAFCRCDFIDTIRVVVAANKLQTAKDALADIDPARCAVVPVGGETRARSVGNALAAIADAGTDVDSWVMVHDAARPCITADDIRRLWDGRGSDDADGGGAVLAMPVTDSLKKIDGDFIGEHLDRAEYITAQTPQIFKLGALQKALAQHPQATDESAAMATTGTRIRIIPGNPRNIKITHPPDLPLAATLLPPPPQH